MFNAALLLLIALTVVHCEPTLDLTESSCSIVDEETRKLRLRNSNGTLTSCVKISVLETSLSNCPTINVETGVSTNVEASCSRWDGSGEPYNTGNSSKSLKQNDLMECQCAAGKDCNEKYAEEIAKAIVAADEILNDYDKGCLRSSVLSKSTHETTSTKEVATTTSETTTKKATTTLKATTATSTTAKNETKEPTTAKKTTTTTTSASTTTTTTATKKPTTTIKAATTTTTITATTMTTKPTAKKATTVVAATTAATMKTAKKPIADITDRTRKSEPTIKATTSDGKETEKPETSTMRKIVTKAITMSAQKTKTAEMAVSTKTTVAPWRNIGKTTAAVTSIDESANDVTEATRSPDDAVTLADTGGREDKIGYVASLEKRRDQEIKAKKDELTRKISLHLIMISLVLVTVTVCQFVFISHVRTIHGRKISSKSKPRHGSAPAIKKKSTAPEQSSANPPPPGKDQHAPANPPLPAPPSALPPLPPPPPAAAPPPEAAPPPPLTPKTPNSVVPKTVDYFK